MKVREKRFTDRHRVDEKTRKGILEQLEDYLSSREEVLFAYLHGSFAEGGKFRDVDVGIYTKEAVKAYTYESDLSHALSQCTGYPVEIRVINEAPVAFQMAVLRNGKVLVDRDEDLRTDFIEDVGRRYREYVHFRNLVLAS